MSDFGQQYSYLFSFPKSVLISLPKNTSRLRFSPYLHTLGRRSFVIWQQGLWEKIVLWMGNVSTCVWLVLESATPSCCTLKPASRDLLPGGVAPHHLSTQLSPLMFVLRCRREPACAPTSVSCTRLHPDWWLFLFFWGSQVAFCLSELFQCPLLPSL